MDETDDARRSVVTVLPAVAPRKLSKVPFVELADGRLQGVVSSGSDAARVYVSSIAAGSHAFSCSTNNNRPCSGLNIGHMCNHLRALVKEAILQYGMTRVVGYLKLPEDASHYDSDADVIADLTGSHESAPAAIVFSRFLNHLAYLEVPASAEPIPELHWFPATTGAR